MFRISLAGVAGLLGLVGLLAADRPAGAAPPIVAAQPSPAGSSAPPILLVVDAVRVAQGIDVHSQLASELATSRDIGPTILITASSAGCAAVECLALIGESRRAGQVILLSGTPNFDEGYDLRVDSWTRTTTRQSQATCNFCTGADTARLATKLIRDAVANAGPASSATPRPAPTPITRASSPISAAPPPPSATLASPHLSGPSTVLAPPAALASSGPGRESTISPPLALALADRPGSAPDPGLASARQNANRAVGFALLGGAGLGGAAGALLLYLDGNQMGCTDFPTGRVCDSRRSSAPGGFVALGVGAALAVTGGLVLWGASRSDSPTTVSLGPGGLHLRRSF